MSTAIIPISDMERMAMAFAKSGLFNIKSPEQALALLLLASAEGVHPAIAMRDFDVIGNRPAKKAEAMLRSFLDHEGSVEWHSMTDELADATFSHPKGGKARISWDMARARKAGLGGKEMYTKFPRQMLANRTISEGCRRIYPASTSGMYEPGEVRQMVREDKRAEKDMGEAEIITEPATPQAPSPIVPLSPAGDADEPLKVTREQLEAIHVALSKHGVDIADLLAKAELTDLREMRSEDAPKAINWIASHKKAATPV